MSISGNGDKMNNSYIQGLVNFVILLTYVGLSLAESDIYTFHLHERFRNIVCTHGADSLGKQPSTFLCGWHCSKSPSCRGVFYNSITSTCSSMTKVSVPDTGCFSQTGSNYFVRMKYETFFPTTETAENCKNNGFQTMNADVDASKTACGAAICCKSRECHDGAPKDYNGDWSKTESGHTCQRWDTLIPHLYDRILVWGLFYGNKPTQAQNYCRDPRPNGYLWCYTTNVLVRWEKCDIPACS